MPCLVSPARKSANGAISAAYAGAFQSGHITASVSDRDDDPGISTSGHHHIHQEPSDTPISVHIRVNVDEEEMAQHNANRGINFFAQQVKKGRHCITNGLWIQRDVHRLADVDLAVAIAGEVGGFQESRRDARRKQLPIPSPMIVIGDLAGILTPQDLFYRSAVLIGTPASIRVLPSHSAVHGRSHFFRGSMNLCEPVR